MKARTNYAKIMIQDYKPEDYGLGFCEPVNPQIIKEVMWGNGIFGPLLSDLVRRVHEGNQEAILKAAKNFAFVLDDMEANRKYWAAQGKKVYAWSVPDLEDTSIAA